MNTYIVIDNNGNKYEYTAKKLYFAHKQAIADGIQVHNIFGKRFDK